VICESSYAAQAITITSACGHLLQAARSGCTVLVNLSSDMSCRMRITYRSRGLNLEVESFLEEKRKTW